MRGQLLGYDTARGEGVISTEDGTRYRFRQEEWRAPAGGVQPGTMVDFNVDEDGGASEIYPVPGQRSGNPLSAEGYEKNPIAAGLLAFFLGGLGVHKFYMGYNSEGAILLAATVVSWILTFIVIGIFGLMAIGIVCLVEAVIYITKSPEEFNRIYVENRRPWF